MRLSERAVKIVPSASLEIIATMRKMKDQGVDVISLAPGEPDFSSPKPATAAAKRALDEGKTHYTVSAGIPELRKAISRYLRERHGLEYSHEQILITVGAKEAIFCAMLSILDPGDEVLIPSPAWFSYPEMAKIAGATPIWVETSPETGFKITADLLRKHLSPRTKLLVLNNPVNPTGELYSEEELKEIANVLKGTGVWVISDEVYADLVYEGKFVPFALVGGYERTVTVNGFSKTFAMTGWRVGYLAGPRELVKVATRMHGHMVTCTTSFAQYGALEALSEDGMKEAKGFAERFRKRREMMVELLRGLLEFKPPKATFYIWAKVGGDDMEFCRKLLEKEHVGVVPGSAFGPSGRGYIRISFATSEENLREAVRRIRRFLGKGE